MYTESNQAELEPAFQKHFQITDLLLFATLFASGALLVAAVMMTFSEWERLILSRPSAYVPQAVAPRIERAAPPDAVPAPVERASYTPPAWVPFDDFVDLAGNRFGQNVGQFGGNGGTCDLEVLASAERPNGCLCLDYDVSQPASFAGYYRAVTGVDLEGVSTLVFEIRGETGGETCTVELSGDNGSRKVSLASVLSGGCAKEWKKVRVPLESFAKNGGWPSPAGVLSFSFDNDTDILWRSTIYVRNVGFER